MASARPSKFIHAGAQALASYRASKLKTTEAIVQHAVQTSKRELTPHDIRALSKVTHTSTDRIKQLISKAKDTFVESIETYVDIHMMATKDALAAGDNETAIKAAQWAIEKTSVDGQSVIERPKETNGSGTKIMIGIRLGGQRDTVEGAPIEGSILEAEV